MMTLVPTRRANERGSGLEIELITSKSRVPGSRNLGKRETFGRVQRRQQAFIERRGRHARVSEETSVKR